MPRSTVLSLAFVALLTATGAAASTGRSWMPGTPDLSLAGVSPEGVDLAWSKPSGKVTGYQLHRAAGTDALRLLAEPGRDLGYRDATTLPGTTYRYAVKAMNGEVPGVFSNVVEVALPPLDADATILPATEPAGGPSSATVTVGSP